MTPLLTDRTDGIVTLTLNVPEKRNALTVELRQRLLAELRGVEADAAVRAIIVTGAQGCFSSGGDISAMSGDVVGSRERLGLLHDILRLLVAGRKPVVTAVSGPAFGGGFSLALAGDYLIADPTARFSASFGRIGLAPDVGIMWTLPQRIGVARARQLFLDGRVVDAREAHAMGIADSVVPEGELLQTALARAQQAASLAPLPIGFMKRILAANLPTLDGLLAAEMDAQTQLLGTRDHSEARHAFLNKRKTNFSGC